MHRRKLWVSTLAVLILLGSSASLADDIPADPSTEPVNHGLTVSEDPTYGYTSENPIKIGGGQKNFVGHRMRDLYLDALRAENGRRVKCKRVGQGGSYESPNAQYGIAIIDKYRIKPKGPDGQRFLYISIYDYEDVRIPNGLALDEAFLAELGSALKDAKVATKPN